MRLKKILAIDFIRVICALGVIVYHFSCHLNNTRFLPFYSFVNGDWGDVFVTIFFMLSGGMLYYSYSNVTSLKDYYYRRWKSLYPMFYIAFAYFFLQNIFSFGNVFYRGKPTSLILSLLGIDGYFLYRYENYYILGEWFLGAIIILYIIYPIFVRLFNKSDKITLLVLFLSYLWVLNTSFFIIGDFRNIISCLFSFSVGMLFIKYTKFFLENLYILLLAIGITIIICFFYLNLGRILHHI